MCIDAYDLWEAHERKQQAALEEFPKCDHCNEHIQSEKYHDIDGIILCPECLATHYTKNTEDYIA